AIPVAAMATATTRTSTDSDRNGRSTSPTPTTTRTEPTDVATHQGAPSLSQRTAARGIVDISTLLDEVHRKPPSKEPSVSFSPVRLNHAVLFVADAARSEHFYRDVFGMEVVTREPRFNAVFLRLPRSGNHHDLGLFGIGEQAGPRRRGIGLYHLAW